MKYIHSHQLEKHYVLQCFVLRNILLVLAMASPDTWTGEAGLKDWDDSLGGCEDSSSFVTAEDSCASSSDDRLTVSAALSVSDAGDSGPYGEEFPELGWDNGDGEIE